MKGQKLEAQAILLPFTSDAHNPEHARQVRAAVDAIRAGMTTDEVMAVLHAADDEYKKDD